MASTKLILARLVDDVSYAQRRKTLVAAIEQLNTTRWDDGTSAWLVYHTAGPNAIHTHLLNNSQIYRDDRDMLVVLDMSSHEFAQVGVDNPSKLSMVLAAGKPQYSAVEEQTRRALADAIMRPRVR